MLLAAAAVAAPRPLLVVGDSLSAAHNIPVEAGWVSLLEDRLQAELPTAPEVINASISGETSAGGLARLPRLLEEHVPGIVVIELGGNDALRGLPPAQLRQNLERMVTLSRDAGAKVLLLGIEIPPNYGSAYRDRVRGVFTGVADATGVPLVPFFLEGVALQPGMMQGDGIHPTAAGQPRLLENVWPALEPLLSE